jgi:hypothetical protein
MRQNSSDIAVCTNFGVDITVLYTIIIIIQAQGDWQGSRWQASERGGLRLPL